MTLSLSFPLRIRELADDDHPRTRLTLHGANTLSDAELVSLLFGAGGDAEQTLQLAQQMLTDAGGLPGIQRLSIEELQQVPGVGVALYSPDLTSGSRFGRRVMPHSSC